MQQKTRFPFFFSFLVLFLCHTIFGLSNALYIYKPLYLNNDTVQRSTLGDKSKSVKHQTFSSAILNTADLAPPKYFNCCFIIEAHHWYLYKCTTLIQNIIESTHELFHGVHWSETEHLRVPNIVHLPNLEWKSEHLTMAV